ncbi:SDR family NAD(P)-dependent oxidoreductase [Acuticoccus mangrovi]|uniref:SDR family oxidoreductase n=1 Tax=Acuticoccus mangrovi TaxID=2796142 RepID=A0A934MH95_9HYPH|nr:SDR family NAD(P)-dependent oxidoreductase [Acuticoccus mangrovi]MBJ3777418.1 SDR family oxidoreductase [Acuticoccus mangrovi]
MIAIAPPFEPLPVPRTAIVTGGAGALGFAIAQRLAAAGRRVALFDRGANVAEMAAALPDAAAFRCDVSEADALRRAYHETVHLMGPPGVVIHAAGYASVAPFLDTDLNNFETSLTVNLTAGFLLYQLAARDLVAMGAGGRFVSITSISGARAGFGRVAYGTAKAGLIHLTAQMALELGPYGITANAVGPGPVDTPMSRAGHTAEMRADYVRTIPMARYGEERETAHAVAFLASDEASYVTGQTLFVDGGYMASGMGVTIAQNAAAVRRPAPSKKDPT